MTKAACVENEGNQGFDSSKSLNVRGGEELLLKMYRERDMFQSISWAKKAFARGARGGSSSL